DLVVVPEFHASPNTQPLYAATAILAAARTAPGRTSATPAPPRGAQAPPPHGPGPAGPVYMGHGTCFLKQKATRGAPTMRLSRPPPLRTRRTFCVAARQLSFKFAADELCLTPSAVSHQMKELERILGMRLFVRRTRALELTTAGLRLLEEVEPLLEEL